MGTTKLLKFNKWRQRKILGTLGSDGKESDCHAGDRGSIPGLGRSPGGAHGNPLHFSCLENPTDRGAWRATVHGVAESQTRRKWWSTSIQWAHLKSTALRFTLAQDILLNPKNIPFPLILSAHTQHRRNHSFIFRSYFEEKCTPFPRPSLNWRPPLRW